MRRIIYSFILIFLNFLILHSVLAQRTKVQTFYNIEKTQLKEVYYVLTSNPKVLDSLYVSYYQNSNLKSKGNYSKNKAQGTWYYFYENGSLRSKGELKNNQPNGTWSYYFENGGESMKGSMVNGIKEGEWEFYYENGKLKSKGNYLKGKKEGIWNYFNEDGAFKARAEFHNDKGIFKEYYESGEVKSEGTISDGKSNGPWKYYYDNSKLKAEGEEKDGLKQGHWKFYYENGELASEGNYLNGKENGKWKYYHENGKLSAEGENKDGQKEGFWKTYYKSGFLKGEATFKAGDGEYKEYYESGKLKVKGNVIKGKNEGWWEYFYESGAQEGKCFFTNGKGNYIGYYESGTLKMEGRIEDGNKVGIWKLYKEDGSLAGYYKTYYENEAPVFVPLAQEKDSSKVDSVVRPIVVKPEVVLPKKKSPHYIAKVNEYQNFILAFHPLAIIKSNIVFSLEYYFQERLGYEIGAGFRKDPLFRSISNLPNDAESQIGYYAYIRQKLYKKDQEYGMFYWAQEFRFTSYDHKVNTSDSTGIYRLGARENIYEFSILVGDRMQKDSRRKGWTIDIYTGIGIGYRTINRNYESEPAKDALFLSLKRQPFTIPFRLGCSIGYLF